MPERPKPANGSQTGSWNVRGAVRRVSVSLWCVGVLSLAACQPPPPEATVVVARPAYEQETRKAQKLMLLGRVDEAADLLTVMAEQGNSRAHFYLAELYRTNRIQPGDKAIDNSGMAIYHLRLAAIANDPDASLQLGKMYFAGEGVSRDQVKARQYLGQASDHGIPEAQYTLGLIHADSSGQFFNPARARDLFEQAERGGHAEAAVRLGWMLFYGEVGKADPEAAAALWRKAIQFDLAEADYGLGLYLLEADGSDKYQAAYHLERAVRAGIDDAIFPLAELYRQNRDSSEFQSRARELYAYAAPTTPMAQYWLGRFALHGIGGGRDRVLAQRSLQAAYDAGIKQALPVLIESHVEVNQFPRNLVEDYLASFNPDDPKAITTLVDFITRHKLALTEYVLPHALRARIKSHYAVTGDAGMQLAEAESARRQGDREQEIVWLERAAEQGSEAAQLRLADVFAASDPTRALAIEQTLAFARYPEGLYRLGVRYLEGRDAPRDETQGRNLLEAAANSGHARASYRLALLLEDDRSVEGKKDVQSPGDSERIQKLMDSASAGGVADASLTLALEASDPATRKAYLLQARAQGNGRAALLYGELVRMDVAVPWSEALQAYSDAAGSGETLARLRLLLLDLYRGDAQASRAAFAKLPNFVEDADPTVRAVALEALARLYGSGYQTIGLAADSSKARRFWQELEPLEAERALAGQAALAERQGDASQARQLWQELAGQTDWALYRLAELEENKTRRTDLLRQSGSVLALPRRALGDNVLPSFQNGWRQQQISDGAEWALYDLGRDLQWGITRPADSRAAKRVFRRGMYLGIGEACLALGEMLHAEGHPAAEEVLRKAIALGQNEARVSLGEVLQPRDDDGALEARRLWSAAAGDGSVRAQILLAYALDKGIGGETDSGKAFDLLRQLYDRGETQVGHNLAGMYVTGRGTDKDVGRGMEILEQAGNQGDARAWLELGKIHASTEFDGYFDPQKASGFLMLAARKGHAEAWRHLGVLYDDGGSLPRNLDLAHKYYLKGAWLGEPYAQYKIGLGYRFGYGGLDVDPHRAYAWLTLAAEQGDVAASMMRDSVLIDLESEELDQVMVLIEEIHTGIAERSGSE